MEIVRTKDTGTLQYEIFFNEDESEAMVFERYRDADAALEHFANISHLMAPLMATASVTGEVLGTPNAKMRRNLNGDQPKLLTQPWLADMTDALPTAAARGNVIPGERPVVAATATADGAAGRAAGPMSPRCSSSMRSYNGCGRAG